MDLIYLDNNATTRPADAVLDAVDEAQRTLWANPSSVHRAGQQVRQQLELARHSVCRLINCRDRDLVLTSGATESNNLALRGIFAARRGRNTIITSPVEHAAVREPAEWLEREQVNIVRLPVDGSGLIDPEALRAAVAEHGRDVALVSLHWANNETGVIQDIPRLAEICREAKVPLHTDATQAVGKLPVDVQEVVVDALSLSAHKFHGPKGVGALYVRQGLRFMPQNQGGPQERERRGGTENVPAVVGMGRAADLAREWLDSDGPAELAARRDRFERRICESLEDVQVNGAAAPRLCNTSNLAFPGLEAEALLVQLSERGVCASAGAACSSGSLEPSPVLLAMGLPEPVAHGSLRFSLSRWTTDEELDRAAETIIATADRVRASMPTA